ncbi:hypothetical protein EON65_01510 [archaeon]|nr:MAG: hypothetical protein EON65_01510 [archaeon]
MLRRTSRLQAPSILIPFTFLYLYACLREFYQLFTPSTGDPTLDSCLTKMFATYYLSAEVGAGFQCLYDNRDNMWDALAGYWMAIAER